MTDQLVVIAMVVDKLPAGAVSRRLLPARAYQRGLTGAYAGYPEADRRASDRYHLTWRVLAAATAGDHPLPARIGRAVVVPEGPSLLAGNDLVRFADHDFAAVGPLISACDEVTLSTVRDHRPFLAGMVTGTTRRLRPTLMFAAGVISGGGYPDANQATIAATIELATLGTLKPVGGPPPSTSRHARCPVSTAVWVFAPGSG